MTTIIKYSINLLPVFIILLASCEKDERDLMNPPMNEEEEVITTVQLVFTDSAGMQPVKVFTFRDVDGPGGNNPIEFDTVLLSQNTTYYTTLWLLNESVLPADTISHEVEEEGDEHLVCYGVNGWNGTIVRTDSDGTYEIGLATKWKTTGISNGAVTITLKHQHEVKDGTCEPGETDAEVTFVTRTQ
jgi:hypothetical protein